MAEMITKLVNNFFWTKDGKEKGIVYSSKPRKFKKALDPKNFAPAHTSIKDFLRASQKPSKTPRKVIDQAKARKVINSRKKGIQ